MIQIKELLDELRQALYDYSPFDPTEALGITLKLMQLTNFKGDLELPNNQFVQMFLDHAEMVTTGTSQPQIKLTAGDKIIVHAYFKELRALENVNGLFLGLDRNRLSKLATRRAEELAKITQYVGPREPDPEFYAQVIAHAEAILTANNVSLT